MKKIFIVIGIALVVVGLSVYVRFRGSTQNIGVDERYQAPSFVLFDVEGNSVSSDDLKGSVLVLNSWASWCPFCTKEFVDFAQVQIEFEHEVVFVAINRGESLEVITQYIDELGVTDDMLILFDPDDSFYKAMGGFSMPETLFVNKNYNVVTHRRGPLDEKATRELVEDILSDHN